MFRLQFIGYVCVSFALLVPNLTFGTNSDEQALAHGYFMNIIQLRAPRMDLETKVITEDLEFEAKGYTKFRDKEIELEQPLGFQNLEEMASFAKKNYCDPQLMNNSKQYFWIRGKHGSIPLLRMKNNTPTSVERLKLFFKFNHKLDSMRVLCPNDE